MRSSSSKALFPLCGRPLIAYGLEALRDLSLDRLVVVVGLDSGALKRALPSHLEYVVQPVPNGTGDALLQAKPALQGAAGHVLVMGADTPLLSSHTLALLKAHHLTSGASMTLLTSQLCPPQGLGRVVRDRAGKVIEVIEGQGEDATGPLEINAGVYCFRADWLWSNLLQLKPGKEGEIFLTDLVSLAAEEREPAEALASQIPMEALGVNTRVQLAQAEQALRERIRQKWMLAGVTLHNPSTIDIDAEVVIEPDVEIYPNTTLLGRTQVGRESILGPNTIVADTQIGPGCRVETSVVKGAVLEEEVEIGPFSHVRPESYLESRVHIGTSVEVKKSHLGKDTRVGHFSYIGDATLGSGVNIGAGTVTCNYDGFQKYSTVIEEGVLIGSDTMLVAPVRIGARAVTGAGAVVTRDVPPDTLVVGVPARKPKRKKGTPSKALLKKSRLGQDSLA